MPGVEVDAPGAGDKVGCTSDTAAYKLEPSQELPQRTGLRDCAGYQVGWVDGGGRVREGRRRRGRSCVLMAPPKEAVDASGEGGGVFQHRRGGRAARTCLLTAAAAAAVAVATAASKERRRSAFVGDLKLTDFKIALASAGVRPGALEAARSCAPGTVCVRKSAESENLQVEGALSDAFYRVRDILYASYQI